MSDNKKKIAAYDIETIGRPLSDEVINMLCKTGNLKDPDKIAAKQAEFRGKLGIDPLTAMACCGGWYASEDDCGYVMLGADADATSEKAFLRDYWGKLSQFDILVGFNCFSFDSKILTLRSAVHEFEIPFRFDRRRYIKSGNHIDIRMVIQDWNTFEAGKLSFFLDMFGLDSKTEGIDGSMVQDYWNEGLHEDIGKYCLQDCRQTMALFNKIKRYFL
jgi:hypothetical protein